MFQNFDNAPVPSPGMGVYKMWRFKRWWLKEFNNNNQGVQICDVRLFWGPSCHRYQYWAHHVYNFILWWFRTPVRVEAGTLYCIDTWNHYRVCRPLVRIIYSKSSSTIVLKHLWISLCLPTFDNIVCNLVLAQTCVLTLEVTMSLKSMIVWYIGWEYFHILLMNILDTINHAPRLSICKLIGLSTCTRSWKRYIMSDHACIHQSQ